MTPDPSVHARHQQERLSVYPAHILIEIRQHQPGQLQAALIDHESAHRGRRVRTRVMSLAMTRTHPPPRNRITEVHRPQPIQPELRSEPSSYRTRATGSDALTPTPRCATMRQTVKTKSGAIAHQTRILLTRCS